MERLIFCKYFKNERPGLDRPPYPGEIGEKIFDSISKEACPLDLAPTASTSLTLALGDSLAVCLLESRGFGEMDFASTHPLGKLGRS